MIIMLTSNSTFEFKQIFMEDYGPKYIEAYIGSTISHGHVSFFIIGEENNFTIAITVR